MVDRYVFDHAQVGKVAAHAIKYDQMRALLIGYHGACLALLQQFAADRNTRSERWYRLFNEVPAVLLIGIVILAVVKPF